MLKENMKAYTERFIDMSFELLHSLGWKILVAIAILIIGKYVIKVLRRTIVKVLEKREVDAAVTCFVSSIVNALLWVMVLIAALSQIGVQTTSFIAILGAAGLAVGLALQGSLSNFAAGFLIILFRPFKVGDAVETAGVFGVIRSINLTSTEIISFDNKKFVIPNSQVMNGVIMNVSAEDLRRVDIVLKISLRSDVTLAKSVALKVIDNHPLVLKNDDPRLVAINRANMVAMSGISRDCLDITIRAWGENTNYWTLFFDLHEQLKIEYDNHKIEFPLPQMAVEVNNKP
jgi:small conductance mechanosensitive channel